MAQDGATYLIVNQTSPLALTLSDDDNTSVLGSRFDGEDNQKWTATQGGRGWALKNVASGRFLGIADDPRSGVKVIADRSPTFWIIVNGPQNPGTFSIIFSNAPLNVSLPNGGNVPPDTPVELEDGLPQGWRFLQVE